MPADTDLKLWGLKPSFRLGRNKTGVGGMLKLTASNLQAYEGKSVKIRDYEYN